MKKMIKNLSFLCKRGKQNKKPSSCYHLTESNKKICHSQIYEKKWGTLQFVSVFPKHKYGESITQENNEGFNENNAVNYDNTCIWHYWITK